MTMIAGVEVLQPIHYDTPSGGEVIIGQCVTEDGHMIVFAHIDLEEVKELAETLHAAYLRYKGTEGEA
jgi:hypothetical protein